jgi:hypothetical protein
MIGTEFYKGQGLGNQLWVYAVVRAIAMQKGYSYGFLGTKHFKGHDFLNLDFGISESRGTATGPKQRIPEGFTAYMRERQVFHPVTAADISPLDPGILDVQDGTFLDGTFQAEEYFGSLKSQVKTWFKATNETSNKCLISLRGGEYRGLKEVFLPKSYYANAMNQIKDLDPGVEFQVITDDLKLAEEYFPGVPAISSGGVRIYLGRFYFSPSSLKIGGDFKSLQAAKYLILSNSSFSWWGAYSNPHVERVIAPKFWARFNTSDGYWSQGDSLTQGWDWIDREGKVFSSEACKNELARYKLL